MFPSNLRYSGASLGYQLAAPVGGGLVPLAAGTIVGLIHGDNLAGLRPYDCDRFRYYPRRCGGARDGASEVTTDVHVITIGETADG